MLLISSNHKTHYICTHVEKKRERIFNYILTFLHSMLLALTTVEKTAKIISTLYRDAWLQQCLLHHKTCKDSFLRASKSLQLFQSLKIFHFSIMLTCFRQTLKTRSTEMVMIACLQFAHLSGLAYEWLLAQNRTG